ncbi:MAG: GntR family transcriptional regulator [Devosiaceae bacterium]|nr:GntR family transcriptional regulator [Devosiaceae bacterium]
MTKWNDTQPIFIQIRQRIIDLILGGDGDTQKALPSVRQISTELAVNPLTVTRSYHSLVELGVGEKRRGLGMFLTENAKEKLLHHEREKFLTKEWPRIIAQIHALDLDADELLGSKSNKKTGGKFNAK